jgi:hypothetical protein
MNQEQDHISEIESLNRRLERASMKLDSYLAEDRVMLATIERISNHCENALRMIDASDRSCDSQDFESATSPESSSTVRSPRNDTFTQNSSRAYPSEQHLIPGQHQDRPVPKSGKKDFIRNIANLREERLRLMLGDMKKSSKNRGNHSV